MLCFTLCFYYFSRWRIWLLESTSRPLRPQYTSSLQYHHSGERVVDPGWLFEQTIGGATPVWNSASKTSALSTWPNKPTNLLWAPLTDLRQSFRGRLRQGVFAVTSSEDGRTIKLTARACVLGADEAVWWGTDNDRQRDTCYPPTWSSSIWYMYRDDQWLTSQQGLIGGQACSATRATTGTRQAL